MSATEHPDSAAASAVETLPSLDPAADAPPELAPAKPEPPTSEPDLIEETPPGIAEPANAAPVPQARTKTKGVADLVFLVDVSGRMATCIDALRRNIEAFIDSLSHGDANNAAPV